LEKKAITIIKLVEEANKISDDKRLAREIKESLKCDWLAEIEGIYIEPE